MKSKKSELGLEHDAGVIISLAKEGVYPTVVNRMPIGLIVWDAEFRVKTWNPSAAKIFGFTAKEALGKHPYDLIVPKEVQPQIGEIWGRLLEGNETAHSVNENLTKDGKTIVCAWSNTPLKKTDGTVIGVLSMVEDITMRTRAEKALEGGNKVYRESLTCENKEQLGKKCLGVAQELTDSKFGFIGEVEPDGRFTAFALSDPGWDECRMPKSDAPKLLSHMEIRGIWGSVVREGKSLIVNDPSTHPDRVGTPEGHPRLTSFLGVPLKRADKVVGMIALANKRQGYNLEDQKVIESLSVAIMEALERKETEWKLQEQSQQLKAHMKELEDRDEVIRKLSTPLVEVWEGIMMIPVVGVLDSTRTRQLTESLLEYITRKKTDIVILSIGGIAAIDTKTANHILRTVHAVKLMGSEMIITGIRPDVATTLVTLGIDLSGIVTRSSMREGLEYAFHKMDLKVTKA